jgi:hypothetical protein
MGFIMAKYNSQSNYATWKLARMKLAIRGSLKTLNL